MSPAAAADDPTPRPSVVIIYTDDQRADQLSRRLMPKTWAALVRHGMDFTTGVVPNGPVCCPSRAGMLTGTYSHTNGVYANKGPFGGFEEFHGDGSTIATWLQTSGYATAFFGKYLNGYGVTGGTYAPPGWDYWQAFVKAGYDLDLGSPWSYSDDGHGEIQGSGYATNFMASDASSWIQGVPQDQPLLTVVAPLAPHEPTLPEPKYIGRFSKIKKYRPPSYNVVSHDEPAYVRRQKEWTPAVSRTVDGHREAMLETDSSIDDLTQTVVQALRSSGRLSNTLLVYASDNGFELGEHRLYGKDVPYDASIRVPFDVRADFLEGPEGVANPSAVGTVDLAPTAAELAGVLPGSPVDGTSLVPVLRGDAASVRDQILVEHFPEGGSPGYCEGRSPDHVFVHYSTGEEEAYDYAADPYELSNLTHGPDPPPAWIAPLRDWVRAQCSPLPPGFGSWPAPDIR